VTPVLWIEITSKRTVMVSRNEFRGLFHVPIPAASIIEPGSLITVKGEELATGFAEVVYGCQRVIVFMRDLEKNKTERVQGKAT